NRPWSHRTSIHTRIGATSPRSSPLTRPQRPRRRPTIACSRKRGPSPPKKIACANSTSTQRPRFVSVRAKRKWWSPRGRCSCLRRPRRLSGTVSRRRFRRSKNDLESRTRSSLLTTARATDHGTVIHNTTAHTYLRLEPTEFEMLPLMDGTRSVKALVVAYYQRNGVLALPRIARLVQ